LGSSTRVWVSLRFHPSFSLVMCCQVLLCCGSSFVAAVAVIVGLAFFQWPSPPECLAACQARPITRNEAGGRSMADYCALSSGLSWTDFREKGFTIVPGFVSESDRGVLQDIYDSLQDDTITNPGGNGGYNVGYRSTWLSGKRIASYLPHIAEKILNMTADAQQEAGVNISHPHFEETFFTTNSSDRARSLMFPWHQDVENYFYFQDLHNYLDFYIFLKKPEPREAGISLVPWDALLMQSPGLHRLTRTGKAAFGFQDLGNGRMLAYEASRDVPYLLNFHLDQISCSPELREGDMLLFAGNTIHRTQEHSSWRISLNIQVHQEYSKGNASVAELLQGGMVKYDFMVKNSGTYIELHKGRIMANRGAQAETMEADLLEALLRSAIFAGFRYRQALLLVRKTLGLLF